MLLNNTKVESSVCNRVCMLFFWAPAELLLLFLPPKPRADSLSKQALSLPTDGETALRTDAVGLRFFIRCGMHANNGFWKVDLKEVENHVIE